MDSDVAFSAPRRDRFWFVFGLFGAVVPLRFAVLKPRLWGLVFGAHPKLSPAPPSPTQASPSLSVGLAKALPKAFCLLDSDVAFSAPRRHRFWSVFGSFGAAVPLRFAVLKPSLWGLVFGAQPKLSPAPPSPGLASPSLGVGLAKALPMAFSYWIQLWRFRPPGGIGFGAFLARLGPPCRCVSLS